MSGPNLVSSGAIGLRPPPEGNEPLPPPVVREVSGALAVAGDLAPGHQDDSHVTTPGHVHVVLLSPAGEVLARKDVQPRVSRCGACPNRHYHGSYFVRFHRTPPKGSSIQGWHDYDVTSVP